MKLLLTCPLGHRQEIAIKPGTSRKAAEEMAELLSARDVRTMCKGKGHAANDTYLGSAFTAKVVDDDN